MKRENGTGTKKTGGILVLTGIVSFILIFTYLSLNLKNIDSGYEMQSLNKKQKTLLEEIDKLKSKKANLLNLQRVEKEMVQQLGYQYPEVSQFIKVFEDSNESNK